MENPATEQKSATRRVRTVKLVPLDADDRDQFVRDNQEAFNYGALEEFGRRDAPHAPETSSSEAHEGHGGMFRFEKRLTSHLP